jgi:predicted nucleotidyltransferase
MKKKIFINNIKTFLEERREIQFVYLFGSFLEGDAFRDIDLAIYIDEADINTQDKFYEIELSTQLERIVKIPVDIIILNHAPCAIVFRASKGMLLKNIDDDIRIHFITLNWKKYWDLKPMLLYHMQERKYGSQ